jgi:hypothetical protein
MIEWAVQHFFAVDWGKTGREKRAIFFDFLWLIATGRKTGVCLKQQESFCW